MMPIFFGVSIAQICDDAAAVISGVESFMGAHNRRNAGHKAEMIKAIRNWEANLRWGNGAITAL